MYSRLCKIMGLFFFCLKQNSYFVTFTGENVTKFKKIILGLEIESCAPQVLFLFPVGKPDSF